MFLTPFSPDAIFTAAMNATTTGSVAVRRALSLGIVAYLILWTAAIVLVSRVFGLGSAIGLSLILVLPLAVAVRMRRQWRAVQGRDFALLLLLLAVVLGGIAYVVWDWRGAGEDRQRVRDFQFAQLAGLVRKDPAFHDVEFSVTEDNERYQICGTVASPSDLERLESLGSRFGFLPSMQEIKVASIPKQTPKPSDKQGP